MNIKLNRYPEGKTRAVTFSYDDGTEADYRLVDMFNKYGAVGTFHLNSGRWCGIGSGKTVVKIDDVKTLYKGHEVSAHMLTHPFPHTLNMDGLRNEIIEDRKNLERISGQLVRGMSYPFGGYNKEIITLLPYLGIEYSRTTQSHKRLCLPENFLEWHPTCHHRDAMECVDAFNDVRWKKLSLFYIWGHSYEFDDNNNWDMMEELLKRICCLDDVWYASNVDIMDYVKALRSLKFSVDNKIVFNPSAQPVWIEADGECVKIDAGYNYL